MGSKPGQGRGESETSPRRLTANDRQKLALQLRRGGATYDDIATQCGYRGKAGAYKAIKTALAETLQEPADELRKLENERMDRALLALWPAITRGNVRAVQQMINLMRRRAALLGLDASKDAGGDGDESALDALMNVLKDRHKDPAEYVDA